MDNIIQLRTVDRKRLDHLQERTETPLASDDIWFIHTVLAQCLGFFAQPPEKVYSRDDTISMSSGVTETRQYWNDHIYLKFQACTIPRHEHVYR